MFSSFIFYLALLFSEILLKLMHFYQVHSYIFPSHRRYYLSSSISMQFYSRLLIHTLSLNTHNVTVFFLFFQGNSSFFIFTHHYTHQPFLVALSGAPLLLLVNSSMYAQTLHLTPPALTNSLSPQSYPSTHSQPLISPQHLTSPL